LYVWGRSVSRFRWGIRGGPHHGVGYRKYRHREEPTPLSAGEATWRSLTFGIEYSISACHNLL
jgi:hypothetical protein